MAKKRIGIAHNVPIRMGQDFSEASLDVLAQVEAVERALKEMGHTPVRIPFTRDLNAFVENIRSSGVEMVFNLCETVDEDPKFAWHPAAVLELLGIPFSGSPSSALMLTTDKVVTKQLLRTSGIPTPNYRIYDGLREKCRNGLHYPVIVKPQYEDASIGIDQESIFTDENDLNKGVKEFFHRFGTMLVEEYISGREFNVSVFGYPTPTVLSPAEIDFSDFPDDLYRIVGYKAKWDINSFEFYHTPRVFPEDVSPKLLCKIKKTVLECARLFMLRDYGRIDMRIDNQDNVHVLEVNANPCISPDAGFPAAIFQSGFSYRDLIEHFVNFMSMRSAHDGHQAVHLAGQG